MPDLLGGRRLLLLLELLCLRRHIRQEPVVRAHVKLLLGRVQLQLPCGECRSLLLQLLL
jgi:hypothetical protein